MWHTSVPAARGRPGHISRGLLVFAVAAVIGATAASATGIINTAAQLGTPLGVAVLLLVAALTTGIPGPGRPVPAVAWGLAAALSLTGAVLFTLRDQAEEVRAGRGRRRSRSANDLQK